MAISLELVSPLNNFPLIVTSADVAFEKPVGISITVTFSDIVGCI